MNGKLKKQELLDLGYRLWSDKLPIYLIPIKLKDTIDGNTVVTCIDGEQVLAKEMDLDTRSGLLAYGIYAED